MANKDLVQRLYDEVWRNRNYGVLDELCANDCQFYDPLQGDQATDLSTYKKTMNDFDRNFAVEDIGLDRIIEAGDTTVFLWHVSVRAKSPSLAGRIGQTSGIGLMRVVNDKIVEHRSVWDTLRFFQGLGLAPKLEVPAVEEAGVPAQH